MRRRARAVVRSQSRSGRGDLRSHRKGFATIAIVARRGAFLCELVHTRLRSHHRLPARAHARADGTGRTTSSIPRSTLFGKLSEDRKSVYLTDGGHIENLGIYELLKRQCRVIIAVDAEADREMAFGSFNTLVRYARIDLGIEIDLPWQQITGKSLTTGAAIHEKGQCW